MRSATLATVTALLLCIAPTTSNAKALSGGEGRSVPDPLEVVPKDLGSTDSLSLTVGTGAGNNGVLSGDKINLLSPAQVAFGQAQQLQKQEQLQSQSLDVSPSVFGGSPRCNTKAYVINIDSQAERLAEVVSWWAAAWPSLQIERVPAVHLPTPRGLGVTKSFIRALDKAIMDGCDVSIFLEDDAKPFPDARFPQDVERALKNMPPTAAMLMLGGHHVKPYGKIDFVSGSTQIEAGYGAYAFAMRSDKLRALREFWARYSEQSLDVYEPDKAWHRLWQDFSGGAYIATPLLADHVAGFSNTYGMERAAARNDRWQGSRKWWEFPYDETDW